MKIDYIKLYKQSNGRIKIADLELLERVCLQCEASLILEIGSGDGGSSVVLANMVRQQYPIGGRLYCIEPVPKQRMVDNMAAYNLQRYYQIIRGCSPWVGGDIVPAEIDLLFIDGYHYTRWALMDYHFWAPRVRHGGVIVFHDTMGGCKEDREQEDFVNRSDWGQAGYVPLVLRAIDIILETDKLEQIDISKAENGGAIAFRKP